MKKMIDTVSLRKFFVSVLGFEPGSTDAGSLPIELLSIESESGSSVPWFKSQNSHKNIETKSAFLKHNNNSFCSYCNIVFFYFPRHTFSLCNRQFCLVNIFYLKHNKKKTERKK